MKVYLVRRMLWLPVCSMRVHLNRTWHCERCKSGKQTSAAKWRGGGDGAMAMNLFMLVSFYLHFSHFSHSLALSLRSRFMPFEMCIASEDCTVNAFRWWQSPKHRVRRTKLATAPLVYRKKGNQTQKVCQTNASSLSPVFILIFIYSSGGWVVQPSKLEKVSPRGISSKQTNEIIKSFQL